MKYQEIFSFAVSSSSPTPYIATYVQKGGLKIFNYQKKNISFINAKIRKKTNSIYRKTYLHTSEKKGFYESLNVINAMILYSSNIIHNSCFAFFFFAFTTYFLQSSKIPYQNLFLPSSLSLFPYFLLFSEENFHWCLNHDA